MWHVALSFQKIDSNSDGERVIIVLEHSVSQWLMGAEQAWLSSRPNVTDLPPVI